MLAGAGDLNQFTILSAAKNLPAHQLGCKIVIASNSEAIPDLHNSALLRRSLLAKGEILHFVPNNSMIYNVCPKQKRPSISRRPSVYKVL